MNARGKHYHPVKPARSYSEQFSRLTDVHGLIIDDEARARYILSTVNYYRLTTYGKHLRRADNPDLFLPGVSLETLYSLYQFDMNLRHLLLPVLEFFEIQLRAKIAYQLAITYGSMGYMGRGKFPRRNTAQRFFHSQKPDRQIQKRGQAAGRTSIRAPSQHQIRRPVSDLGRRRIVYFRYARLAV